MRKLKFLFAACALLVSTGMYAKTDITSTYLKNADLTTDPNTANNGWTLGDNWRQDYQKSSDDDHVNVVEFYAGWGGLDKTNYSMSQTITLPAGYYRIAVNAFFRQGNDGNGTNENKAWIFAGEKKQNVVGIQQSELWAYTGTNDLWKASNAFKLGKYSNEFDFHLDAETEIPVGFQGVFDEARCWVILGPVKLYEYTAADYQSDFDAKKAEAEALYDKKMNATVLSELKAAANATFSTVDEVTTAIHTLNEKIEAANTSIINYASLKSSIDAYAAIAATYDDAGQTAYATASAEATAAYDNGTATDGNAEIAALKAALATACKAQVQPTDGCDMSAYIVNAGIDGNTDGWTIEINANGGYVGGPMKPSKDAMECWAQSTVSDQDKGKSFNYYQTISLPNGVYTVGADLFNSTNGEENDHDGVDWNGGGNAGVYGKTASAEVISLVTTNSDSFAPYTTGEIFVYNGTLTIGVKNIAPLTGRWFVCDNFKLTYVRQLTENDKNTVTSAYLAGSFNNWNATALELEKVGETNSYSCELDIEDFVDVTFKPVINGNWMDFNKFTMDESNPAGWLENEGGNDDNIKLNNRTALYKTYTVTATWEPQLDVTAGWTLKIEGKDLRPKTVFTASFVNGANWENVYAHVWNGTSDNITGEWPGQKLEKSGTITDNSATYDVYTYSYEDYKKAPEAPDHIIFNNGGNGAQTDDLDFVDGMVFTGDIVFDPVYYVIGSNQAKTDKAIFSGNWDAATTTDLMTKDGDKWTISFNNVELTEPIIFKVIKKNYKEATEVEEWYPAGTDNDNVIDKTGDFNIVITFDGTNVIYTATPSTETFTVTDAGWATAVTHNAVDFTNATGLTAYIATLKGTTVTLTETAKIPANTPIVLKGVTAKADVIETAPAVEENALTWYDSYTVNDSYAHIYALTKGNDGKAKFARVKDGEVFTNKAVIELIGASARESLDVVFADETTGINAIAAQKNAEAIYNMNGQRVAAPAKGLYIMNGKKVMVK